MFWWLMFWNRWNKFINVKKLLLFLKLNLYSVFNIIFNGGLEKIQADSVTQTAALSKQVLLLLYTAHIKQSHLKCSPILQKSCYHLRMC
jgi:hypothetical protein